MKTKIFLSAISIIILLISFFLPSLILKNNIADVNVTFPEKYNYTEKINISGTIEQGTESFINSDYPIIAQKIHVNVGDKIKKGDLLISVDKKSTISAYNELFSSFGLDLKKATVKQVVDLADSLPDNITAMLPENIKILIEKSSENLKTDVEINKFLNEDNLINLIYAKSDGFVKEINIDFTKLSNFNKPLLTIVSDNNLIAKIPINEKDINKIEINQKAIFTSTGTGDKENFTATVKKISPNARQSSTFQSENTVVDVYLAFKDDNQRLKAGYNLNGEIYIGNEKETCVLPYEAVFQDENNEEFVYILNNSNYIIKKKITTGKEFENSVEILDGINNDEPCVIPYDWKLLKDNKSVNVVKYQENIKK